MNILFRLVAVVVISLLAGASRSSGTSNAAPQESDNAAAAPRPDPGSKLDLSQWKLTLPIDDDPMNNCRVKEILADDLVRGFTDVQFHLNSAGDRVFWCPVDGATTENTKYPRSELREMLEPGDTRVNWFARGTHRMKACCRVLQVPNNSKVVIGQIHAHSGEARPLVKLQFFQGRIEALVKVSPTKSKDIKLVWPEIGLNRDIDYEIELRNEILSIRVNGLTQTQDIEKNILGG